MAETYDFPADLRAAQQELHRVNAELAALLRALPWSVEPHPGWRDPADKWHPTERPASPGWTEEERRQVAELRARALELSIEVSCHSWWATLSGETTIAARMALKHLGEQEPAD
ncbi:hypothetical protein [Streptomyces orinoci]|uniref:Uncharacterized protein n=1 Tax=Streptomyces orinoci TaxID=67339 RepID=A0ABV3JZJ1_STRON|nr:hypothetical protein [Streptomyces orinoci]